jgi:HD superfamily phosphohydrolase
MQHEDYSHRLVKSGEIAEILRDERLNEFAITPDEIIGVLDGRVGGILHEIVAGDFDADKMDYLRRDSWHSGVDYGRFDHERLIESLTFRRAEEKGDRPVLAIEEGGIHTAEAMVLARYWMFMQVYFHDVRRAYDWHLADFIREVVLSGGHYPTDTAEYLCLNDVTVLAALQRAEGNEKAERLLRRKHWRVCGQSPATDDVTVVRDCTERAGKALRELPAVFADYAERHRLGPAKSAGFQVKLEGGDRFRPIGELSPVIKNMPPMCQVRLYASPDVEGAAREVMGPYSVTREAKK